eukprot:CAMPEP_0113455992 /NCGR_PEP_ID=MMETSP0014_2-20120614/8658_1 /TAXON_ID=2857 /ORGANISM="Nitzschia sp." /LENGTH=171 /DNA_ID=CAMNT_0000347433 /DNA_START=1052 /DNA_END=1567 /DNA_ORIENTATION=+ /assembly_acc=CAM_ASM_000159
MSSTAAQSRCTIAGDFNKCPAGGSFTFNGEPRFLDATMVCPLDSVDQSGFIVASQQGKCTCDVATYDDTPPSSGGTGTKIDDLACQCFVCPAGSRVGFAYTCATPIAGPCLNFDCFGSCNSDPNFNPLGIDTETLAPTDAPVAQPSSASTMSVSSVTGTAALAAVLLRMIM